MTDLEEGAALFHAARYWDAHEAWERLWLTLDGDAKLLVQGLIQGAAACLKLAEGKADVARRIAARAAPKLARVALGVDGPAFAAALAAHLDGGPPPRL